VKVTVLLADSGQSDSSGKTHVLGLGWTVIAAPTTQPMAVLVLVNFEASAEAAAGPHEIVLRLVTSDGSPVELPDSEKPVIVKAVVNLGPRADGTPADAPATAPLVVNLGPGLPLEPGQRYRWEAEVDGRPEQRADVSFVTRPAVAVTS
jgi:hypothetical protein